MTQKGFNLSTPISMRILMDVEERLSIVRQGLTEEIITEGELHSMLSEKMHPVMYNGFEPSGLMHLGTGLASVLEVNQLIKAGIESIMYIADWFAYLNNKLGGDMEKIRMAGEYFIDGWKACGIDTEHVKFVWASKLMEDIEYWEMMLKISKLVTINRVMRSVPIMGRTESEVKNPSMIIYPLMQATDVFMLNDEKGVDICQLGMDQRKVNMLARDISKDLGRPAPVAIHHHLLLGLQQGGRMGGGFDENKNIDDEITFKMSKSKPDTAIFINNTEDEVNKKIGKAYCQQGDIKTNPILEICRYVVFPKLGGLTIKRKEEYGGKLEFQSYQELEGAFAKGGIHPMDLKNATAEALNEILDPIREYFEKNEKAHEHYEMAKKAAESVTR